MSHRFRRNPPALLPIHARSPWPKKTGEGGAWRPDSGEGARRRHGLGWGKGGGG